VPAIHPRKNPRRGDPSRPASAAATISGAIAIQANAGCPYFGKLTV